MFHFRRPRSQPAPVEEALAYYTPQPIRTAPPRCLSPIEQMYAYYEFE